MFLEKPKVFKQKDEITLKILRFYSSSEAKEQLIIDNAYVLNSKLGQGRCAQIFKVIKRDTKQPFVLKVIDYQKIRNQFKSFEAQKLIQLMNRQYSLLSFCHSPFIVKCFGAFKNQICHCLILQFCTGKTLKEIMIENDYCLEEATAVKIIKHVALGIKELSQKNIIHRDLTWENIMESQTYFKIIDLGLGKHLKETQQNQNSSIVGTRSMMAPEVKRRLNYGMKVDIYSLGLILLKIVVNNYPFSQRTPQILSKKLLNKNGQPLNDEILDFLKSTLKQNPDERLSEVQLTYHSLIFDQQQNTNSSKLIDIENLQAKAKETQIEEYQRPRYESSISRKALMPTNSITSLQDYDLILVGKKAEFILNLILEIESQGKRFIQEEMVIKLLFFFTQKAYSYMLKVWEYFYNNSNKSIQVGWRQIEKNLNDASLKQSKYKRKLQKMLSSKTYQMGKKMKTFFFKIFKDKDYAMVKKELAIFFNSEQITINQAQQNQLTSFYLKKTVQLLPKKKQFLRKSLEAYEQIINMNVNEQNFDSQVNKVLEKDKPYNGLKKN